MSVSSIKDPELLRVLQDIADQQTAIVVRLIAVEGLMLQIASDMCLFAGTENAILKFALYRANMNVGQMRKDLEEVWKRWRTVVDRAAVNATPAPTETKQ